MKNMNFQRYQENQQKEGKSACISVLLCYMSSICICSVYVDLYIYMHYLYIYTDICSLSSDST